MGAVMDALMDAVISGSSALMDAVNPGSSALMISHRTPSENRALRTNFTEMATLIPEIPRGNGNAKFRVLRANDFA